MATLAPTSQAGVVEGVIAALVRPVLDHPLGMRISMCKSGLDFAAPSGGDRFCVRVPYCDEATKWFVIFNERFPNEVPDIVLDGAHDFEILWEQLNSVLSYDARNPESLVQLLLEIREQIRVGYLQQAKEMASGRIAFEVDTMQTIEAVEMLLVSDNGRLKLRCVVPINVRSSKVSSWVNNIVANLPPARLTLVYDLEAPDEAPQLSLWQCQQFEFLFALTKLPVWQNDECVVNYIPQLVRSVEKSVNQWADLVGWRREIFMQIARDMSLLEVDTHRYGRASFAINTATHPSSPYPLVLHVELPSNPASAALRGTLQTMQHMLSSNAPLTVTFSVSCPLNDFQTTAVQLHNELGRQMQELRTAIVDSSAHLGP